MRLFNQSYPPARISESLSRKSIKIPLSGVSEPTIRKYDLHTLAQVFPLSLVLEFLNLKSSAVVGVTPS
jgi:hypothetical protein